jgi:hypothetical protein
VILLVESGALEAHFGLTAEDAAAIESHDFRVQVQGIDVGVVAHRTLPNLDPTHRTVPWILDLDTGQSALPIRPGQVATLQWSRPMAEAGWRVPMAALTEGVRGMWTGFVVVEADGQSTVQRVDLQVLHTLPDAVVVTGALKTGDRLLIEGVDRVVAGQWVSPVEGAGEGLHD